MEGGGEGIRACAAEQLVWQVDELRIKCAGREVINVLGMHGKENKAIYQPLGLHANCN